MQPVTQPVVGAVRGARALRALRALQALPALPWLLVLGLATVTLLQVGTPAPDIGRYALYWCLAVTLPGLLVARATVGTRGNWPEDIALGAVTGLALELLCFALWSLLGLQQQLWVWPLLVVGTFVAVPRLRRHWRISSPRPLPRLWSWGVASSIGVSLLRTSRRRSLRPSGSVGAWVTSIHATRRTWRGRFRRNPCVPRG